MSDDANNDLNEPEKKGRSKLKIFLGVLIALLLVCTGVCCGGPFAGGWVMNSGDVTVPEIDDSWFIRDFRASDPVPALPFKRPLETQCSPMKNGVRVLFNHLWYNAITQGYDAKIWLEGPEGDYDSYGLYVWGNNVFLRDEVEAGGYTNRVLVCKLDASDWKKMTAQQ